MGVAAGLPQTSPHPEDERLAHVGLLARFFQRPEIGAMVGVVAVFILFTSTASGFANLDGFARWSDEASNLGMMAVVVSLLMIGGEFDLSAGVMVGSSGLLLGLLVTRVHLSILPAIVLVLLFGATIGLVNGALVTKTRLPSFIVTLATFFVLQGLNLGGTLAITGAVYVSDIDRAHGYGWARRLLAATVWSPHDYQVRVFWWLGELAIATWVLTRTRVGNWIFAVGGDAAAARAVGVPVTRTKIGLFITTSIVASLLGVMTAVNLRSIQAGQGVGREFYYIIAAVVGGCLLTGGFGSAIGGSLGALIIAMAEIGIPYSGWDSDWSFLFLGVILLLAVLLNTAIRRRAEASGRH
ncbi:MAG: ABC transporter permease [Gaiellaceae bacterium]